MGLIGAGRPHPVTHLVAAQDADAPARPVPAIARRRATRRPNAPHAPVRWAPTGAKSVGQPRSSKAFRPRNHIPAYSNSADRRPDGARPRSSSRFPRAPRDAARPRAIPPDRCRRRAAEIRARADAGTSAGLARRGSGPHRRRVLADRDAARAAGRNAGSSQPAFALQPSRHGTPRSVSYPELHSPGGRAPQREPATRFRWKSTWRVAGAFLFGVRIRPNRQRHHAFQTGLAPTRENAGPITASGERNGPMIGVTFVGPAVGADSMAGDPRTGADMTLISFSKSGASAVQVTKGRDRPLWSGTTFHMTRRRIRQNAFRGTEYHPGAICDAGPATSTGNRSALRQASHPGGSPHAN